MLKSNIGIINALVRITSGLTCLTYGTARLIKKPGSPGNMLLILLSAMKVGEGIVRYCPVTDIVKNTSVLEKMNVPKKSNTPQVNE